MSQILTKLRQIMKAKEIHWYVLPRTDQHQSEYICECDKRVQYVSGFSGTNALSLISLDEAYLWTDGRYFIQAQKQLHEGWTLKKLIANQKRWFQVLLDAYHPDRNVIGIDSRLISASLACDKFKILKEKGYKIQAEPYNLIDEIWQNRPKSTACQIFIHEEWAGKSIVEKVSWVRKAITDKKGKAALFNGLSQIAWILNLRSGQIPYNPYFKSTLVIRQEGGSLYLNKEHVSFGDKKIRQHLKKVNIEIEDLPPKFDQKTLIQSSALNYYLFSNLVDPIQWSQGIGLFRAVRDQKQIQGFRNCHIRDGVAMAKFWAWRSKQLKISQWQAALYMNKMRAQNQHFKSPSFITTSAGGPNAAIIHYKPQQNCSLVIQKDMIHLVDSGGQYLDGTTDVTRTFHFGKPTQQQKDSYTRVLLGNLDVQRMIWPKNVDLQGIDFDLLARRRLFEVGKDYQHGTGHGVGYFLGVHEGPVGISKINTTVFKPGMIVSNEPGYYEEGKYGIRIENLIIVQQKDGLYYFQNLTMCPYDLNLIETSLLTQKNKVFINEYHKKVFETLSPRLQNNQDAVDWLKFATRNLQ